MFDRTCWRVLVVAVLLGLGRFATAQATAGSSEPVGSAKTVPESAGAVAPTAAPLSAAANETPAPKQTSLELQTEKLLAMATELKLRVDKTNKDILSYAVVRQAQEIEQYVHQLKQSGARK